METQSLVGSDTGVAKLRDECKGFLNLVIRRVDITYTILKKIISEKIRDFRISELCIIPGN